MPRRFLLVHGWENHRPADHWQYWLAERLRGRGEQVLYPQLPSPDEPRLDDWLRLLRAELALLGSGERIVICHSLGCLLWLRHAASAAESRPVDRLLLVCPPSPSALPHALASFFPAPGDRDALRRSVTQRPELVCTDDDPWCPEGAASLFGAELDMDVHVIEGAGHLAIPDGYGAWPAVEDWALYGTLAAQRAAAA
jgi:uncharacterized protein